jgi:hypothetical protein
VESDEDVNTFSRFIRSLFTDREKEQRAGDAWRTGWIALGVGLATTLIPIILHMLKVI